MLTDGALYCIHRFLVGGWAIIEVKIEIKSTMPLNNKWLSLFQMMILPKYKNIV